MRSQTRRVLVRVLYALVLATSFALAGVAHGAPSDGHNRVTTSQVAP